MFDAPPKPLYDYVIERYRDIVYRFAKIKINNRCYLEKYQSVDNV
jgi:hypothetical protein